MDLPKGASSSGGRGDRGGEGRGERGSGGGQQKRPSVFSRLGTKGALQGKGKKRGGHGKRGGGGGGAADKHKEGKKTSGGGGRHHGQQRPPSSSSSATPSGDPGPAPASPTIDPDWENWDEKNLDYDDELMLEKKRELLQRELAKQLQQDPGVKEQPAEGKAHRGAAAAAVATKVPAHAQQAKPMTAASSESSNSSDSESSGSSSLGAVQRESNVFDITSAVQILCISYFFTLLV